MLARAKICHDTLVDLTREEAFETPDDLASRAAVSGASCDVLDGGRPGGQILIMNLNLDGWIRVALPALPGHGYFGRELRYS